MPDPDIRTLSREEGRRQIIRRFRRQIGRCEARLRDHERWNEILFRKGERQEPPDTATLRILSHQTKRLSQFIAKNGDADERDDTIYHRFKLMRNDGATSPLCADEPRAVDLDTETCILVDEYVTCPECLKRMAIRREEERGNEPGI